RRRAGRAGAVAVRAGGGQPGVRRAARWAARPGGPGRVHAGTLKHQGGDRLPVSAAATRPYVARPGPNAERLGPTRPPPPVPHSWSAMHREYDGRRMDGFYTTGGINTPATTPPRTLRPTR